MRTFRHSFIVNAPIHRVWDFYTDINHLVVITPPNMRLAIVKSTHNTLVEGSEIWLTGILFTRSNWHSRITSLKPYDYVDEMISGRFNKWIHMHKFCEVEENMTKVIDEIDFELHLGLIGKIFEAYVYSTLEKIFAYREKATIKAMKVIK